MKATDKMTNDETFALGMCYLNGGVGIEEDWSRGVELLKRAAEQGHAEAQYELGRCVVNRHGFSGSEATSGRRAAAWFALAGEQGHVKAQVRAAELFYWEGQMSHSAYWYREAAEQGNAEAQFKFGQLCEKGEGTLLDYAEAAKWYLKAAESAYHVTAANTALAALYAKGLGVPKDAEIAAVYYRRAGFTDKEVSMALAELS